MELGALCIICINWTEFEVVKDSRTTRRRGAGIGELTRTDKCRYQVQQTARDENRKSAAAGSGRKGQQFYHQRKAMGRQGKTALKVVTVKKFPDNKTVTVNRGVLNRSTHVTESIFHSSSEIIIKVKRKIQFEINRWQKPWKRKRIGVAHDQNFPWWWPIHNLSYKPPNRDNRKVWKISSYRARYRPASMPLRRKFRQHGSSKWEKPSEIFLREQSNAERHYQKNHKINGAMNENASKGIYRRNLSSGSNPSE